VTRAHRSAIVALLGASVVLTACAGRGNASSGASSDPTAARSSAGSGAAASGAPAQPAVRGGDRALLLASKVSGCSPAPLNSTDSTAPGLATHPAALALAASAASCTLRGRTAVILAFTTASDQRRANSELARVDAYYATGTTAGTRWSAAPEQIAAVSGQQSIVQDVALALRGLIETGLSR
jgi:hypothetical protein